MKNLIISAEKAREILSDSGFPIGTDRLKNGVIQDVFRPPIGFATRCDKKDGKDHYALIKCSIVVNKKHEDYDKYVGSITEKSSLIKDAINSEVSNFTIEEMKSNPEDVQQAILERLQKLFNSRFIVKVTFDNIVYQ